MKDKSFWEKWKEEKLAKQKEKGVTPLSFANPLTQYADKELQDQRFKLCQDCDKFISDTNRCQECGCYMNLKTTLLAAKCPLEKW